MQQISLNKIYSGKVRDLYAIDNDRMLMVATDRLSAFDVILDDPIPGKGEILTQISNFWFKQLANIMPNHFTGETVYDVLPKAEADLIKDRAVVCKRLTPIKIESIVRGYLTGSGLKDYRRTGTICGLVLPPGLQEASKLPQPIFTPSSKAEVGDHDINISYQACEQLIGVDLAAEVKQKAIALYQQAAEYALSKGIIICDTKFEFGLDKEGVLTLMDEVLTPDSSRFWAVENYQEGTNPPSFDKQFIRDWLEQSGWNKQAPAPKVPAEIIQKTVDKYQEALTLLTQ
ncbi:phosphoribosylaminoimidazolesuccinocarboxamide synthase [Testudinibacter sp. TR-2022]|uniref:phosphoribosylaminoimidazolesuccinocarboxamide synthase n=1 Tax=Testudinibacter sp. TR-2022 TaxID=2585029 RepID=UPI00111AEF9F|nr:phosphoribosylaminoimidazolesuccinocarboxamide synthase [Testudinibacter sp. TR-2022]TNH03320.1 phosphoribosylaminoimidazolesuccinocarboxamide synthase [Pasteurellaceae bacterium Phil31]TNH08194.1 phosphoribosylaminoimidazolesuccinocarboxamide synthase [Testudinibacter sp. TR-2022]TNH11381.1 phosphoribosylaminoimidazolesuccinocarboxamide synthase [Testudinibacter sp. TR-2022]TNH12677.1 phosphoribosylaminoimidazolesuccinocarboxamide synthase [Testudinibacter sp. TR-2022]TNH17148.1 phosphorib